jgi:pyridoxamine 5'-phosphate oxidase
VSDLRQLLRRLEVFPDEPPVFDTRELPADPHGLFTDWLYAAVHDGVQAPHAMTLSTAGADGDPTARVLILKDVSADGWRFASDAAGRKGRDLAARPAAALTFHWQQQARQVRVLGTVRPATTEQSAADFLARSPAARAESLLGRQSTRLADPAERACAVRAAVARLERDPGLVAPGWTLYTLRAHEVEFWQGARDRGHTRVSYTRTDDGWRRGLLWP